MQGGGRNNQFGPLYLLVIGVFSELNYRFGFSKSYYDFWTEKWADKLGGVKLRNEKNQKFKKRLYLCKCKEVRQSLKLKYYAHSISKL